MDASDLSWSENAFDFIIRAVAHLKPFLPNPFHLSDDGLTENGGNLLSECVREGIANTICNCDYLLPGGVTIIFEGNKIIFKKCRAYALAARKSNAWRR